MTITRTMTRSMPRPRTADEPAMRTPTEPATAAGPDARIGRADGWRLGLLVSLVVVFLAGSSAPTPLYATYQREWGFSLITTTIVFGVYALAVLAGLLFLGRLSDHVGRRPVIAVAVLLQIAAMLVFAQASGLDALLLARVVQGVATGGALGALGAAMLDLSPRLGTSANAAAPGAGTGTGALVSGLIVSYLPHPTHTIYFLLAGVLAAQFVAALLFVEAADRKPGAVRSLVPELRVSAPVRRAILTAAPVVFAVWALAGFYGSVGPSLVTALSGRNSVVLGGMGLFLLAGTASLVTLLLRRVSAAAMLRIGLAGLTAGVVGVLVAITEGSTTGFLLATVVAGAGFGSGFQGAIRTVLVETPPADRAGVLSIVYLVSYLGMGVPAVVAGWLVVHGNALLTVSRWYGAALLVLAAATALALRLRRSEAA